MIWIIGIVLCLGAVHQQGLDKKKAQEKKLREMASSVKKPSDSPDSILRKD